jgi:hypothetical protein
MRFLAAVNLLCLPFLLVCAQSSSPRGDAAQTRPIQNEPQLVRLTTSIVKEDYCSEYGATFLQWRLKLTYTNIGERPVLIDSKSKWIYRALVSRDLKAASAEQYEQAPFASYADVSQFGFVSTPEEDSFVLLKPGAVFNVEADCRVRLSSGTPDTTDDLRSGDHVLQVRVATWYYYVDPATYREKWSSRGYVYSGNITSVPLPFTIKKERTVTACDTRSP